ncbi:hypothetical protein FKW77_008437 [Venturia effusa]|uniref:JmjC domain-containing protein n=1 Tax=Venturia effusa TaxID=50376 RepID=A0A517KX04_9PEZI|nr:hypothetical protein FKW77_008437 [Venturia effusa]
MFNDQRQAIVAMQAQLKHELSKPFDSSDTILEIGEHPLSIIRDQPQEALELARKHLNVFPFYKVPECWRRLYTEASLWKAVKLKSSEEDLETKFVEILDMAVIVAGAPKREGMIRHVFCRMAYMDVERRQAIAQAQLAADHQAKRQKLTHGTSLYPDIPLRFLTGPYPKRKLDHPMPRYLNMAFATFQEKLNDDHNQDRTKGCRPFIITQAITEWPALADPNKMWRNPHHWLVNTIGGRRLVPVEIGRAYTDDDWTQKIIPFRDFLKDHLLPPSSSSSSDDDGREIGYLAQHDLFAQIPSLKSDIRTPDFCYTTPPLPEGPDAPTFPNIEDEIDDVKINVWLGPAGTMSPLHTDPHHNILAQVFGYKYVRLYAPAEKVYPKPKPQKEGDVDMSNTSQVDVGLWINGESCETGVIKDEFPLFPDAEYVEEVLGPGEALFIPRGWWHYVESLSVSCSVSFWWD